MWHDARCIVDSEKMFAGSIITTVIIALPSTCLSLSLDRYKWVKAFCPFSQIQESRSSWTEGGHSTHTNVWAP